jgi:SOS-response transcriptional repressor LexA
MTLASRITQAREKAGLKKAEFARRLGVTSQAVSQWESGANEPSKENLGKIARLTEVNPDWLIYGVSTLDPDDQGAHEFRGRVVPMLQWSEISDSSAASRKDRTYARSNFPCGPRSFQVIVEDDANEDKTDGRKSIYAGDAIIVDPDQPPKPGNMVVIKYRDEIKVRQFRPRSDHILLAPLNPEFDEVIVDSLTPDILIGVVVETGRSRIN